MRTCGLLATYKAGCRCDSCKTAFTSYYANLSSLQKKTIHAKHRANHLKTRYGLSLEDYERLLQKQKGHCGICLKTTMNSAGKRLAVDHDHTDNLIRGLLCGRCNAYLAWYEEFYDHITGYLISANQRP